jgi:hypothetical protein
MSVAPAATLRQRANAEVVARMTAADPVLVDVRPAIEVLPAMTPQTILTSGAPLPWDQYVGGQRRAIIGGALYEGLAHDPIEADRKLASGEILLGGCHDFGCVGSMAGIVTASMPVFVVENRPFGNHAHCTIFEGPGHGRLNYGVYNEDVHRNLDFIRDLLAPTLAAAVTASGGIPLRPLMRRALHMGDELHSRNTAASLLFLVSLLPALLELSSTRPDEVRQTIAFLQDGNYFFLRLSMAASKATADAAHGISGSSIVTAMTFNWRDFSIRVSGLGSTWFSAPIPTVKARLFDDYTPADIAYMGGESIINETVSLGGFAQAAAFPLQSFSGGTPEEMIRRNLAMYDITAAEHPDFKIPYLRFRGTPTGIDILRVVETGITPTMNIGVAHRDGGQIGAGVLDAPLECFTAALAAYTACYGS